MKGWKTFIFFGAVSALGIITMLQAANIEGLLLPLLCQIDPGVEYVKTECTDKVILIAGAVVTGLGVAGKVLRFITTSSVFKPE